MKTPKTGPEHAEKDRFPRSLAADEVASEGRPPAGSAKGEVKPPNHESAAGRGRKRLSERPVVPT